MFKDKLLDEEYKNNYRIIGQLFDTYWLIEFEDQILYDGPARSTRKSAV